MTTILSTLKAYGRYFLNKAAAIVLLLVLMAVFSALPAEHPTPFAELIYVAILIIGCVVAAPFVRLLVFPEAAEYAESDRLRTDLQSTYRQPALLHYWFATGVCYLITAACFATLSH